MAEFDLPVPPLVMFLAPSVLRITENLSPEDWHRKLNDEMQKPYGIRLRIDKNCQQCGADWRTNWVVCLAHPDKTVVRYGEFRYCLRCYELNRKELVNGQSPNPPRRHMTEEQEERAMAAYRQQTKSPPNILYDGDEGTYVEDEGWVD